MPAAPNSRENVPPAPVQLLVGIFLLVLVFCYPIVVYTNHVKEEASTSLPGTSAEATTVPPQINGLEAMSIAQMQPASNPIENAPHRSPTVVSSRRSASNPSRGDEPAKSATGKRVLHKLAATPGWGRSASPTLSRTWSRTISQKHAKAALIALWHQTFKTKSNH